MIAPSRASTPSPVVEDPFDTCVLVLLPWLASRFDLSAGAFRGEGDEAAAPAELLTAQGRAIYRALGVEARLPHVIRVKIDRWPAASDTALAAAARHSPLARAARAALSGSAESFLGAIRPFASPDSGYALDPDTGAPGSLAAAHHLLVVVRPHWFVLRATPLPRVSDEVVIAMNERLLAAPAP
jgi:hypothetical protein